MASKQTVIEPVIRAALSVSPDKGIALIQRQIDVSERLKSGGHVDGNVYGSWENTTRNYLVKAFGEGSPNVRDFDDVSRVWGVPMNADDAWWDQSRRKRLEAQLVRLGSYVELLRTEVELQTPVGHAAPAPTSSRSVSRQVFVVHGHNETVRETCARFLEKLELEPIILHEKPNAGRTIIEKFQEYSNVGFAVVLLTGDDMGATKESDPSTLKLRARQNVIFELGFFIGKLGRSRVCALYELGVEIPSDYSGILFIELDARGAWRFQLCRELKAVGIDIDLNKTI
jgi:predicted nucleotide-binding protein